LQIVLLTLQKTSFAYTFLSPLKSFLHMCVSHWTKGSPRGVDVKENIDMRSQVTHFDTTMRAGSGQKPLW